MLDQEKIGRFIAEERKDKELTQKQLAEMLHISDKAVSKWETGHALPDNAILLDLCEVLNISVNELLSGERLGEAFVNEAAETHIMELMQENEEKTRDRKWSIAASAIGIALFVLVFLFSFFSGGSSWINFTDIPSMLIVAGILFAFLLISGQCGDFFRAFPLAFGKQTSASSAEVTSAVRALRSAVFASLGAGAFGFLTGMIIVCGRSLGMISVSVSDALLSGGAELNDLISLFGNMMAIVLLIPLYGVTLALFFYAMQQGIKRRHP